MEMGYSGLCGIYLRGLESGLGKKHDWWDVAAGAVIGAGSAYIFTRPFAKKHNLSISPVAGDGHYGVYASMTF